MLLSMLIIASVAFRILMVWSGLVHMALHPSRRIEWDRSMLIALPEPFVLAASLWWVLNTNALAPAPSWIAATIGAVLGVASVALFLWSFLAYRRVGTGHYVDTNHQVVKTGPYALVRHPFYTSAFLCWAGLALASNDSVIMGLLVLYVIPAYWYYAKTEEKMMSAALGETYDDYLRSVPMFLPNPFALR